MAEKPEFLGYESGKTPAALPPPKTEVEMLSEAVAALLAIKATLERIEAKGGI